MQTPIDTHEFEKTVETWKQIDHPTGRARANLRAARTLCHIKNTVDQISNGLMQDLELSLVHADTDDYVYLHELKDALASMRAAIHKTAGTMLLASWFQASIDNATEGHQAR